jgi:ankyrin repeat protein
MFNFKYALYLIVLVWFFPVKAGSYDDFFEGLKTDEVKVVANLLARGFDPNTLSFDGQYPLVLAIRRPSPAVLDLLLRTKGLRAEVRTAKDESPLMLASMAGMVEVCKRLIALDADVNKTGWTPLHYAASGGHIEVIKLLLSHSAYIDAESPNLTTPLMMAAMYGSPQAVELLLAEGADASLKNQKGMTALDFADVADKQASAKILVRHMIALPIP